ncbi:hypothetical protein BOX37_31675 [Nocardia mangyaensis]|uniref:Uncharacterized protein n=1 Tax=Nocardia mangyaensis TaxID=2213200 RepID=A0A1J0W0M8_9NOCA|nr:hypothetical protein BOX37_31675 [Nocardia mangyaensis]
MGGGGTKGTEGTQGEVDMVFVAGLLFAVVGGIALGQAPMVGVPLLVVAVALGFLGGRELVRRWFSVGRAGGWKRPTAWLTVFGVGGTSVHGDGGSGSASLGGSDSGGGGDSSSSSGGGSGS